MRSLEEHHGAHFRRERVQAGAAFTAAGRQKPLEAEAIDRQAGHCQSRRNGRSPGHHADRDPLRDRGPHQFKPRIAEQRSAGVADQHHPGAAREPRQQLRQPLALVVRMQ